MQESRKVYKVVRYEFSDRRFYSDDSEYSDNSEVGGASRKKKLRK